MICLLFFFFQAEDGIRDLTVTGVQTCALPISRWTCSLRREGLTICKALSPCSIPSRMKGISTRYLSADVRKNVQMCMPSSKFSPKRRTDFRVPLMVTSSLASPDPDARSLRIAEATQGADRVIELIIHQPATIC